MTRFYLQIFTLSEPFSGVYEHGVLMNLDEGVRPPRPSAGEAPELSDHLWDTIQRCWDAKPGRRPDAKHVWGVIEGIKELKNFPSVTARLAEKSSSLQPLSSFRMQEQPALVPSGPSHHFREGLSWIVCVLLSLVTDHPKRSVPSDGSRSVPTFSERPANHLQRRKFC